MGSVPFILLLNQSGRIDEITIDLSAGGWQILLTIAKTVENVELAFAQLAGRMIDAI